MNYDFTYLACWSLATFGAANGIAISSLLHPFRVWIGGKSQLLGKLINCCMCLGWWIGLIYSLLGFSPAEHLMGVTSIAPRLIFDAFLGSACAWIIYVLLGDKQFGGK